MHFWKEFLRDRRACVWALGLPLLTATASAGEIQLRKGNLGVRCDPARLVLDVIPAGRGAVRFTTDWAAPERIESLQQSEASARWELPGRQLTLSLRLETNAVLVEFTARQAGTLNWPALAPDAQVRAWMLPTFEGVWVPAADTNWQAFLAQASPLNTTAGLVLPFWGLDAGDFTLTCQVLNPYHNALSFDAADGRLRLRLAHEFARNEAEKKFGLRIVVGAASPIEPARQYRRWLQARGEFVTLTDKIKRTPEAAKLPGAAHIYLWGDGPLGAEDVKDWRGFARELQRQSQSTNASFGTRLWSAFATEPRDAVSQIASAEWPNRYLKGVVTEALNHALSSANFADVTNEISEAELWRRNGERFAAGFGGFLRPRAQWGEGLSPAMIRELADAGFDRLWLGTAGWAGLVQQPETVAVAREKGFLIGTYDSYHSIHAPGLSENETWPTAQFDAELYRTGAVTNADGTPSRGFKQRGFHLNAQAARPWVERRVSGLMKIFNANSWFVDCDGFGEYFDDYSSTHPATQAEDLAARMARCAWIRDTYGAVIGSEGCFVGAAATLHFAHGVLTPVIGWGDSDLTGKSSKFYLGAYYPPNEPAVFFKPVPLKEAYRRRFYDPRFRLPLFETVFHDSVVATHHWSNPSLKFPEVAGPVALLELLYNVPPLYHLNRAEFAKRKAELQRHYAIFSPLHRELATQPLTEFRWLNADRSVQQTVFGDQVEITANFGETPFEGNGLKLGPQSLLVTWRGTGRQRTYAGPAN